jgi:hypothetical protein
MQKEFHLQRKSHYNQDALGKKGSMLAGSIVPFA